MHSTNPPTDDEAIARDNEREEEEFFEDVPPYCSVGWRWGPFLLVGLFSLLAVFRVFGGFGVSVSVMQIIVAPLLIMMFFQLLTLANGLGWGGFAFALLRLLIACGFAALCLAAIMGMSMHMGFD